MAINPDLLVSAAMLQNYLVDKDTGKPLTNGLITLYKDNARSFYKNWYYQTGSPGAYTWIPLNNPLSLSNAGTIQDTNGNDVIPFYYPYEENDENVPEAYYITVYSVDENGDPAVLQFTRENFPFQPSNSSPTAENPTFRNYLVNNVYWRNVGTLAATSVTDAVIAPSQHEGFTNGDIRFLKNVTGATDTLSFLPMTETLENDITPEEYINFQCSVPQLGELVKCVQYPISLHVKTLQNVLGSIVIQAQNTAGNANNYLDIYIYQYLGSGALSQPDPILIKRIVLGNSFQKFIIPFIFPDASGLTLGGGGDDALFLRIQYPLSVTCNINHTKPQLYLSNRVPDNDFDTYSDISAITDSPRTGDKKYSFNSFQPFGWVPANDGSIGSAASSATCRANIDTWPLYKMLWEGVINQFCPVSGGRGASAISDFNANKTLTLSPQLGRVSIGANPQLGTPELLTLVDTVGNFVEVASNAPLTGSPILFTNVGGTLPGGLVAGTIYFARRLSLTRFDIYPTLEDANAIINPIVLTTTGTGSTFVRSAIGSIAGSTNVTLDVTQLPSHNHPGSTLPSINTKAINTPATNTVAGPGADTSYTVNVAAQGGGLPHPNMQPGYYEYIFLKL